MTLFMVGCLIVSGCGSIHIFEESHIHIEKRAVIDSDDAVVSVAVRMINLVQAQSAPQEEPLAGFNWDEKLLTKNKGDDDNE